MHTLTHASGSHFTTHSGALFVLTLPHTLTRSFFHKLTVRMFWVLSCVVSSQDMNQAVCPTQTPALAADTEKETTSEGSATSSKPSALNPWESREGVCCGHSLFVCMRVHVCSSSHEAKLARLRASLLPSTRGNVCDGRSLFVCVLARLLLRIILHCLLLLPV